MIGILNIAGHQRKLLSLTTSYSKTVCKKGYPDSLPIAHFFKVSFLTEEGDDFFADWMYGRNKNYPSLKGQWYNGTIIFYDEASYGQEFLQYELTEALATSFRVDYDQEKGMVTTLEIFATERIYDRKFIINSKYYAITFDYVKPEEVQPTQSKNTFEVKATLEKEENKKGFVPLGIPAFGGTLEKGTIDFSYEIKGDSAQELILQIRDGNKEIYKEEIKNGDNRLTEGKHNWQWNGFDNDNVLDTKLLTSQKLNLYITAKSNSGETAHSIVDFKLSYKKVNWVDVKINNKDLEIWVNLRVNLRNGGAKGLNRGNSVSKSALSFYGKHPLSKQNKSYEELRELAFYGINRYWSRNKHNIGLGVTINSQCYEVTTCADFDEKGMIAPKIAFFTNKANTRFNSSRNWFLSRCLFYRIGYVQYSDLKNDPLNFTDGWVYIMEEDAIMDFMETAAHELGHQLLAEYSGILRSYNHKGSSTLISQAPLKGTIYPKNGEIDLMKYVEQNQVPADFYDRVILAEEDLLGALWLSKMEIQ